MNNLSFVTPIAYDYKYAFISIKSYYDIADEIILGIDQDYISWSGNKYEFDEVQLENFIKNIDTQGKIKVVRGNFHSTPTPMRNDTEERSFLSKQCKPGNWIVQIDSDEILLNAKQFGEWMEQVPKTVGVKTCSITVLKSFQDKHIVIDADQKTDGVFPIATQLRGAYTTARETGEPSIMAPLILLHFSWGRTKEELKQKLENWSHSRDFDIVRFLDIWDSITLDNYRNYTNIHPLHGPWWPKLKVVEALGAEL